MLANEHILAVGDIHGRLDLLERLLREVLPRLPQGTRLVGLGDYVDRGPDTRGVLERLLALRQERPETVLLRGNHEQMLLDAARGRRRTMHLVNGGAETLASYDLGPGGYGDLPLRHLDLLAGLPAMHRAPGYVFVHAGLRPGVPLEEQSEADMLWIRDAFLNSDHDFGVTVVFGHTPFDEPLVRPGRYGLDTGAGYGNRLTCLKLPEEELISLR